jgi:hypothetical protein
MYFYNVKKGDEILEVHSEFSNNKNKNKVIVKELIGGKYYKENVERFSAGKDKKIKGSDIEKGSGEYYISDKLEN